MQRCWRDLSVVVEGNKLTPRAGALEHETRTAFAKIRLEPAPVRGRKPGQKNATKGRAA
jgi:hypothetical protein